MKEYKAGIYLRLSKEHDEKNNSIEAQREITTKYAITNGYKIVKEYVDNGYSGIIDSRPALDQMMIDISRGFINMVIVKDISRLTRNKNKTGWYTEIFFPDNDVRFISVTEFIDSGKRYEIDDTIMLRGIANQYYIADISKKIKANKRAMKELGQFVENQVPYGYKKLDTDKHEIAIDEKVADNIRNIYNMYIDGQTSSQIAEYLNNKKIKNPSRYMKMKNHTKKWSAEQINDILRNQFYIGNTVMNKYKTNYITKICVRNNNIDNWIIKENTHEAIIEKEIYNKVQEIKKRKKGRKSVTHKYLLRDLVYCGQCKRKFQYKVYKSADKQRFLYDSASFNCSLLYKKKCNNETHILEKHLNQIVKNEVAKKLNIIEIDKATNKIIEYYKENDEDMKKIKEYQNEQERLERKKRILYKKKCEKYITVEKFKKEYEETKKEITKYKNLLEELKQNDKYQLDEKQIKEFAQNFKKNCMTNDFLKEIINNIKVYSKNRIEIIFNL